MGRGRLRVVVPPHAVALADQLDAMGERLERAQHVVNAGSTPAPAAIAVAAAASALLTSWGSERDSSSTAMITSPSGPRSSPSARL